MKTRMTRLLAAVMLCLAPAAAEAAVTYTVTGAPGLKISATTDTFISQINPTYFSEGSSRFTCALSDGLKSSGACAFYFQPVTDRFGVPLTNILLGAGSAAANYSFVGRILGTPGTYISAEHGGRKDTVTLTITDSDALPGGVAAVPEPATWALMLVGFGLTGAAIRRRRASATRVIA